MLSHVLPGGARPDLRDRGQRNAILPREAASVSMRTLGSRQANRARIGGAELRARVAFTGQSRRAALRDHVAHVVVVCSKPEVIGPNARRVVTRVTDQDPGSDGAVSQLPCNAVCWLDATLERRLPIALRVARARPYPALAGLVNVRPEGAFLEGATLLTFLRAEFPAAGFDLALVGEEPLLAGGALHADARPVAALPTSHWRRKRLAPRPTRQQVAARGALSRNVTRHSLKSIRAGADS
jgi:hypothetical protein